MDDAALEPLDTGTRSAASRLFRKLRPDGHAAEAMARATRDAATTAGRGARTVADYSARRIRTFPVTSAAVALGAGFLLGALLSPRKWFDSSTQRAPGAGRHAVQEPR